MIGLMIFGTISLWLVIAITLGVVLPKWFGLKSYWRWMVSMVLIPLFAFAPVADEVIAAPQIWRMCDSVHGYQFVNGMDEKKAYGRNVYYRSRESNVEDIFPPTVKVTLREGGYFDFDTEEPILYRYSLHVKRGWLGMPAGSSGNTMAVLLNGCNSNSMDSIEYSPGKWIPTLLRNSDVKEISLTDGSKPFNYPSRRK
jgi:hypothetical protein